MAERKTSTEQPTPLDPNTAPEPTEEAHEETVGGSPHAAAEAVSDHPPRAIVAEVPHDTSNTTVVLGRDIPLPLYTVVFGALAAVTVVEVASAEIFPDGWLLTLWLAALSVTKAVTVMWFYMHLKNDSRIFAGAIILPIFIALIATLFLSAVPMTGY
jgi:hypothetical protein